MARVLRDENKLMVPDMVVFEGAAFSSMTLAVFTGGVGEEPR